MPDTDFRDGFAAGWESALQAAESHCVHVWHPTGQVGRAVTDVELVWLRQALKQTTHDSGGEHG